MILYIRTDSPIAIIGLWDETKHAIHEEKQLELGRSMAKELPGHIEALVGDWQRLGGIVAFKGPGSFTGLRIGITCANTLAYGLGVPVVGAVGGDWIASGVRQLAERKNERIVLPEYGGEAHITKPRK